MHDSCSRICIHTVHLGDLTGLEVLLRHGANVDYDNGAAVCVACQVGDIRVLKRLLAKRPALETLHMACLASARSNALSSAQRSFVFDRLMDARDQELAEAENMRLLLADSVIELPSSTQLPALLITRGVEVLFAILKIAVATSSLELFHSLVECQDVATITKLFRIARETDMSRERRLWIYGLLLTRNVHALELSRALVNFLKLGQLDDISIVKLLLFHGAEVGHENAVAFQHALGARSLEVILLLSQSLVDDDTVCVAFEIVQNDPRLSSMARAEIYTSLLQWNISAPLAYKALITHLEKAIATSLSCDCYSQRARMSTKRMLAA
jgi:hypothetical protein